MSSAQDIYTYQLLTDVAERQNIRLLELYPGHKGETLRCSLRVISLVDESLPVYAALSYAWGDPRKTRRILVHGQELQITVNLESALQHLRNEISSRLMWIDAICVDQKNFEERSEQVQLMPQIYKNARSVLVWLGAMYAEAQLISYYENTALPIGTPNLIEDYIHALESVLRDASWWMRLWVVQEVAFSPNVILFCSRSYPVYWRRLSNMKERLCNYQSGSTPDILYETTSASPSLMSRALRVRIGRIFRKSEAIERIREVCQDLSGVSTEIPDSGQYTFESVIALAGHRECSDPRDRIYALQNLFGREKISVPDYTKSIAMVFLEATISMIKQTGYLNAICNTYPAEALSKTHPRPHASELIPSWVPNWDSPQESESLIDFELPQQRFTASRGSSTVSNTFISTMPWLLSLRGIIFDTIVHKSMKFRTDIEGWQLELHQWKTDYVDEMQYPTGEAGLHVYMRTLLRDTVRSSGGEKFCRMIPYDIIIHRVLFLRWLKSKDPVGGYKADGCCKPEILSEEPRHLEFDIQIDSALALSLNGWSICMTEQGYIGLVSGCAEVGDQICVLRGASVPLVLRQADASMHNDVLPSKARYYTLSGTAYLHGIMDGEAYDDRASKSEETILLV